MKISYIKFGIVVLMLSSLLFSACDEDVVREQSPLMSKSSNKVYFPEQTANPVLPISANTYKVKIARKVFQSALTVKLKCIAAASDTLFSIPPSVTFDAGDADTVVTVTVGKVELMKKYLVQIVVDDNSQIDAYEQSSDYHMIALNLMKEDFTPVGIGKWTDGIICKVFSSVPVATYDVPVEYSPSTKSYRIIDPYGFGTYPNTEAADVVRVSNLIFNVKDPSKVTIGGNPIGAGFGLGIDYGYGEFYVGIPSSGAPGVMVDKVITFAGGTTLAVGMLTQNSGKFGWFCNECKLVLP